MNDGLRLTFEEQGLLVYVHSGSEGYLDILELDEQLKFCLERRGVIFTEKT